MLRRTIIASCHCANSSIGRKSNDDDDDFIVPDDIEEVDEEDDAGQTSSRASSSSRPSSRLSAYSRSSRATDAESDEDQPKAKKTAARPALKSESSSKGAGSFLTAAEQRALKQKDEKKSTEDPFSFLVDVKDKDGVRPGQPGYDPRTLYIPPRAWTNFTPFEKQFWEIKQNHFDTILFFQKGKFLELYEEDARIGHREFDLKLTQRVKMSMVCKADQHRLRSLTAGVGWSSRDVFQLLGRQVPCQR